MCDVQIQGYASNKLAYPCICTSLFSLSGARLDYDVIPTEYIE